MELGLTRPLQRALHTVPESRGNADIFFSWAATEADGILYCLHDPSGIGFVYTGELSDPDRAVVEGIRICLEQLGVLPELIKKYMADLGEVRRCKVRTARQSGRLGNFSRDPDACIPVEGQPLYSVRPHSDCVTDGRKRRNTADLFAEGMTKHYRTKKIYYGEHEAARHSARPLPTSRIYAGYQFYARAEYDGYPARDCFRYAALTILDWLKERMGQAVLPPELRCPEAARFADIDNSSLKSITGNEYRIVSVPEQGIWALLLREPDPKINGRSFITNAAVRILNDREIEFGVRIDILDRQTCAAEAEMAYRPKFVRLLFLTPGLHFSQSTPLLYKDYCTVDSRRALTTLQNLIGSETDQLPLVVFTQIELKKPEKALPLPSPVPTAEIIPPLGRIPEAKGAPMLFQKEFQLTEKRPPMPGKPEQKAAAPAKKPAKKPAKPEKIFYYLPYDAAGFAEHTYGFGRVFVLEGEFFEDFRKKLGQSIQPGDILLIEPKRFGGGIRVFPFRPGLTGKAYAAFVEPLQQILQRYSKQKDYTFGRIVFAEQAQSAARQAELEQLRRQAAETKKSEQELILLDDLEQASLRVSELEEQADTLRRQLSAEYQRGVDTGRERSDSLETELARVKAENVDLREHNISMQDDFDKVKDIRGALNAVRTFPRLPQTCAEIAAYFRQVFAERIDFTDQGLRTAEKCGIKPAVLWEYLYQMATGLYDLHRKNAADIEAEFKLLSGMEAAMSEGSQTRGNPNLMALRKDTYKGREISIEPHVKFPKSGKRAGAAYQRIYYCYDDRTRKIIIGWVGDHLDNHSSLSFS